jgi:hypothetical protein
MNVINVNDVERELRKIAAHAIYPQAQQWVLSVGRNHILGKIGEKDADMNFRVYDPAKIRPDVYGEPPPVAKLPEWAKEAIKQGEELHWFDPVQVQRRPLWQAINVIVTWFNIWPPTDTRLRRLDRVNFHTALAGAAMWFQDVQQNIWEYVKDKPPVMKTYEHGFFWVRLVTALHFEREGRLMNHCVGNGSYYERWRNAKSEYYSLRDKHNKPHATVEVTVDMRRRGAVLQCKGNSNHKPAPIYQPYIRRFFNDMGWTISGDQHNID